MTILLDFVSCELCFFYYILACIKPQSIPDIRMQDMGKDYKMALGLAIMEMFGVQGKAYSDTAELHDYNLYYGNWVPR